MSETRIEFNPVMPEGYEKLDGIEVVQDKEENVKTFNGIIKLGGKDNEIIRRVKLPDLAEMWGYDPEDRKRYMADPEKWEMQRQIDELTNRVETLEGQLGATSSSTSPSRRERIADWVSLRRPVTYIQTRRPVGGGEAIEEEVTEERVNSRALALGGAALAGAGIFAGWLIWGRHSGYNPAHELNTIINQNNHLQAEVNHLTNTVNHDSGVIAQNHHLLVQDHAELKNLHGQVNHLYQLEKVEHGSGGGQVVGNVNLNNYPWTVAYSYQPKNPTELISRAMRVYGHGAHFVKVKGTTQIALGNGKIVNHQQMVAINRIIAKLGSS